MLKLFMSLIWAALALGPGFIISMYVVMFREKSKKLDEEIRRAAAEGRTVNRVTAVLKRRSRAYDNESNSWQRNCVYEYTFRDKKYRYFTFSGFDAPHTITLYFFSEKPRRATTSERHLFAASKVPWFWLYLAVAATIYINMG